MALLPVEEAQARLLNTATPIARVETLRLALAKSRILSDTLHAHLTQPPFDASAMDGYALRAEDALSVGTELTVIGVSAAGHGFDGTLKAGECVRIFTGAPVPAGADCILLQEDAEKLADGTRIRTAFSVSKGRHIRPKGQDFYLGDALLPAGTRLDYTRLMLAAATNNATVNVYKKPLVALLATGDELVLPGTTPGPNQIIASNSFALHALCDDLGADVLDLGLVPDQHDAIVAAVRRAEMAGADVLVTTGGASVGDHDLVQSALTAAGMVLDFWKIAMRPGKPLMVGRLGGMHVLGLPGNPVSSMVCSLLFLEPLLCHLARQPLPKRRVSVKTNAPLAANDQRQDYLRARLESQPDGFLVATPFGKQDSSMMNVLANADALIVRPPFAPELTVGQECPALLLRV
ncbi:gephyrin-like molybdotransferase Glp [Rhizobium oryziradicis]|uniref:Molybdopterin molybdenumtransferase n=1 Tax=Rhizobium oryziradicis TaxID=1867956 RepID=A0A1Q8ZNZ9_9HYPH|nr:gephyrin-like molybdotransferase Glp [Rhizobium oryziradicis]OLP43498.1 molybdopterin molybdenumtransferase MoeA [Rhizobium oryziradicis]